MYTNISNVTVKGVIHWIF